MNKIVLFIIVVLGLNLGLSAQITVQTNSPNQNASEVGLVKDYKYQTVPNDPLNARIYTLSNGLTVYMTVYKDKPRVKAFIAVKAGSKNDPHETTGLAHYFEHLMFKGSERIGAKDYEKEKVELDKIEALFEAYRQIPMTNIEARSAMYKKIDSVSNVAAKLAIPNEYMKTMSLIGSTGTNAYTSLDQTVFVENVPSNQLENWAKVQSERFQHNVIRLFHTELETVYEEKNMTMSKDSRKSYEALLQGLYQKHTYGIQTTIGTQKDLKNPSITLIKQFYNQYYVPNNIAICLSGDFDPDKTIRIIDHYFGEWRPGNVPQFKAPIEAPITKPVVKIVKGPEAANIMMAWRLEGAYSHQALLLQLTDMILSNSKVGLIDMNLNHQQKVLQAGSQPIINADYSALLMYAYPKQGQNLDQLRDLLLQQLDKIRKGDFPDWLIPAIINDLRLNQTKQFEKNTNRANFFVNSFTNGIPYTTAVNKIDLMSKITKEEIVAFAKGFLNDNNYVIVRKEKGEDPNIQKIKNFPITPIEIDRVSKSEFYSEIETSDVEAIEPIYLDYQKDIAKFSIKKDKIKVLYQENKENETFSIYYITEMGSFQNKKIDMAVSYLEYLGIPKYTSAQLKEEFYKLGCSFSVSSSNDQTYVRLSGLSRNFKQAISLFEELLSNPIANETALENMKLDIIKGRQMAKSNPRSITRNLQMFGIYGANNPATYILSENEIKNVKSDELIGLIKNLNSYKHRILYYGPINQETLKVQLEKSHLTPKKLKKIPKGVKFTPLATEKDQIFFVGFDVRQATIILYNRDEKYTPALAPKVKMFNEYFGGGMNSIVFQEMREARSLAYTAYSSYTLANEKDKYNYTFGYIASQHDKVLPAISNFIQLMDTMPYSKSAFELAKHNIIETMRTQRITKDGVLFAYLSAEKRGIDYDLRKDVFKTVKTITYEDIKKFQFDHMSNRPRTILIMGNEKEMDFKALGKYGKVNKVEFKDIFGY